MTFDAKFVREAFQNTGPRNALRTLSERERMFILSWFSLKWRSDVLR